MREAGWCHGPNSLKTCYAAQYTCPFCGTADRYRLIAFEIGEWFGCLTGSAKLIDFAPSKPLVAHIRRYVAAHVSDGQYRTADLYAAGVDDRVDVTGMPGYPTGSVDLFICSHVLEHVADDRKALRELVRILRLGGRGVVLVPIVLRLDAIDEDPTVTDPRERWRRFGQDDHVRLYAKAGFVVPAPRGRVRGQ